MRNLLRSLIILGIALLMIVAMGGEGKSLALAEKGTLNMSIDASGAATSAFYTPSLTGVEMARIKLAATVEDMKVERLVLRTINGAGNIANVKLLGTGLPSDPSTPLTAGTATFNFALGSEIIVPAYGSRVVTAVVDTTGLGTLVAGQLGVLGFGTINAIGADSGTEIHESIPGTAGTNFYVAGDDRYSGDVGDTIYFTVDARAGTFTAPGYYMVTTDEDGVNLVTGNLQLNGETIQTSWGTGDVISKLTKTESVAGNGRAGTKYNVGDIIYVYDSDDKETRFAVVTTGVDARDPISGLVFSPTGNVVISSHTDRVTKLTNANALVGNVMRFEEVEPVITLNPDSPSGTASPSSEQTVAVFNVKALGTRDMSFNSLTVEKSGNNSPEANVTDFSLYNGPNRIARVARTTIGGTFDDEGNNGPTLYRHRINICAGNTVANVAEIGNITEAEAATIAIGDRLTIVAAGGAQTHTSIVTVTDTDGALAACDGNVATGRVLTFNGNVVVRSHDTTLKIYNNRVHFDSNQVNTNDVALAEQTITAGQTFTLTVKADTTSVRSGVSSGTVVIFGVILPGVAGPLQVGVVDAPTADTDQNQVEGLNWDYTPLGSGTAMYKTEGNSYPVNANTLIY